MKVSKGLISYICIYLLVIIGLASTVYAQEADSVSDKIKVELFTMSHCPWGTRAENALLSVIEKTQDIVDFSLYFIANAREDGSFDSLHGQKEVDEQIRQVCAMSHYPDKYRQFILNRNKNLDEENWEIVAKEVGIDPRVIKTCWRSEEGGSLFRKNIKRANELQVVSSPTIFINAQKYTGLRDEFSFAKAICQNQTTAYCQGLGECLTDGHCRQPGKIGKCLTVKGQRRCSYKEPVKFSLKVVNDLSCSFCKEDLSERIKQRHIGAQIEVIDSNSTQGKRLIRAYKAKTLPLYILDKEFEKVDKFEDVKQFYIRHKDGSFQFAPQFYQPIVYLEREREPGEIALFVMSMCPYAIEAEEEIINFFSKKTRQDIWFNIHYIVKEDKTAQLQERGSKAFKVVSSRKFSSLHGEEELIEDIRQLCILKHEPAKFFEYLKCRNKDINDSSLILRCLESSEIGFEVIDTCISSGEGMNLLEKDVELIKELDIGSSPTFLWENQVQLNSMDAFRQFMSQQQKEQSEDAQPKNSAVVSTKDVIPIIVFYGPRCSHCRWLLDEYIPKLEREFGERVAFEYYDISIQENFEKKMRLEEESGVLGGAIPQVFVAGRALVGRPEIKDELRNILEKIAAEGTDRVERKAVLTGSDAQGSTRLIERFKSFTPLVILGAGLLDGINPCAFSTIVFFFSFLVFMGFNLRQMVLVGISFTAAVFLTYLGLGLGAFVGLERLRMFALFSKYFDTTVGGLAIVLGLGSLYDYIYFKRTGESKGMLLQLPRSVKNTIHRSIRIIRDKGRAGLLRLLFIAFTVGVLVSLIESMCTGQIYLPTLTFILKMKVMWWRSFLFLVLYNAMFILPLIIVFLLTLCGVSSQWWARLVQRSLGKVKLATALFFFGLGVFILLW